jgi:hypothetical protein
VPPTEEKYKHLEIIILRGDIGIGELKLRSMNRPTTTRYSIIIYNHPKLFEEYDKKGSTDKGF